MTRPASRPWMDWLRRTWIVPHVSADNRRALRLTVDLVRQSRFLVLMIVAANVLSAVFEGSTMVILAFAVRAVTGSEDAESPGFGERVTPVLEAVRERLGLDGLFLSLVLLAIVSQLFRSGLQFVGQAGTAVLHARVNGDVHRRIFSQFLSISFAQFSRYKIGNLASYLSQAPVMGKLISQANTLLNQSLVVAALVGLLFWVSWPITLVALVGLGGLSLLMRRIIRRVRHNSQEYVKASVSLTERIVEYLHGMRLVRTFARQTYASQDVERHVVDSVTTRRKGLMWQATIAPLMESMAVTGVALFLIGGYGLLRNQTSNTIPYLMTFLIVFYRLLPRITGINACVARINNDWPVVHRISSILRTDDKVYLSRGRRTFRQLRDGIEFRNVSMVYQEGEQPAVDDLSFHIPHGEMVALVGHSGCGKSTVADLLLRLYDPTSGAILVDNVDLRDWNVDSWRDRIGVVGQDTFTFNTSMRDNIAFGRLDANESDVVKAAQAAGAHGFIVATARGYDTVIGDRGYRLSGGQRQRTAIARALLRDPDFLVLDEATSNLDSKSERDFQEALLKRRGERTVLAIAHRLSTIAMADRIYVLDSGRLVEQGTHEELLAVKGRYAAMWEIQSRQAG